MSESARMASKSRDISGKAEEQMRKVSYTVDAAQYEIQWSGQELWGLDGRFPEEGNLNLMREDRGIYNL